MQYVAKLATKHKIVPLRPASLVKKKSFHYNHNTKNILSSRALTLQSHVPSRSFSTPPTPLSTKAKVCTFGSPNKGLHNTLIHSPGVKPLISKPGPQHANFSQGRRNFFTSSFQKIATRTQINNLARKTDSFFAGAPKNLGRPNLSFNLAPSLSFNLAQNLEFSTSQKKKKPSKNVKANGKEKVQKELKIEDIYQQKDPVQHVLDRPDTYIGSVESSKKTMWSLHRDKIAFKDVEYNMGLLKIFDEILVNASDNKIRSGARMTKLEVTINTDDNSIQVLNDGAGIPPEIHKETKQYVPEMVFGSLLTGSNFDDTASKVTGGRNGYGAKLTNIFSSRFYIETRTNNKKYCQEWTNNMSQKSEPTITDDKGPDFTSITFWPDLKRFGMKKLTHTDTLKLMEKRVHDVAGIYGSSLKVSYNQQPIHYDNVYDYWKKYQVDDCPPVFYKVNDRWTIGVCISLSFPPVSFVNAISTSRGGSHVSYVTDQIAKGLEKLLQKKDKIFNDIQPAQIKSRIGLFLSCLIENPAFDSQTKETLISKSSNFGSECIIPDKFLNQIIQETPLAQSLMEVLKRKQTQELQRGVQSQGKKSDSNKLYGIPKLYDAYQAGGKKRRECTLILTEGDSAKALAIAGLSVVGHELYGVYPLRGKVLNVRDAGHKKLMNNDEIQILCKILGLDFKNRNPQPEHLRYGSVMIMADQDHDGSHIKGLLINFFHYFWPTLLEKHNFLQEFVTPILKFTVGNQVIPFFTIPESRKWLQANPDKKPKIKYYKGLGTSSTEEGKAYFNKLSTHRINFQWDPEANESIELAFGKEKSTERKSWVAQYNSEDFIDHSKNTVTYTDFVNRELRMFSHADNLRSIASVMDGLKPGPRKILYGCFKKNQTEEIKVTQLAGYISEHSAYHHGEASLHATIVRMAQDYVGSNNIPLLHPSGQFGTRFQGGKDAASARYIFTKLQRITRKIFPQEDDPILDYQTEDGQKVEPKFYVPIIPMILVNGSLGLGTGWSSFIPMFNPMDIIQNLQNALTGKPLNDMMPYYKGFRGKIFPGNEDHLSWISQGVVEHVNKNLYKISEIPPSVWIDQYKQQLDQEIKEGRDGKDTISDYTIKYNKSGSVHFYVQVHPDAISKETDLVQFFRLSSKLSGNNMHLFDSQGVLKKYSSPLEIMNDYLPVRLDYYEKRKRYLLDSGADRLEKLESQFQFCSRVINQQIQISNQSHSAIVQQLKDQGFKPVDNSYQYLLRTPIYHFSQEKMQELSNEKQKTESQLQTLTNTSGAQMWLNDLGDLKTEL